MALEQTIGFIGAGQMATALAKGFVESNLVNPSQVVASDPVPSARQLFSQKVGGRLLEGNAEVVNASQVLILAVKPSQAIPVLEDIKDTFTAQHLLISIAAGVTLARLEGALEGTRRVIRAMPNTPALVGASATGYALGKAAYGEDGELAQRLFSAVGLAFRVQESLLDAVTGLSGSGPAYVFLFIEAAQTVLGSAKLLLESGQHTGALKDMVTSPGGTTMEGLHQLEKAGLRGAVIDAVRAAADKARLLGQAAT
jgi:pyrroline-5-carboxylate reductase